MADLLLKAPPHVLAAGFQTLRSVDDLAALLRVRPDQLTHYTYGRGYAYRHFTIRKRRGGDRPINEPLAGLKILQQRMGQVLTAVSTPRECVHGFVEGRSIATNAQEHVEKDWVLTVDLKDFFPSINFGRVRGLFISRYGLPASVATVIARICTYDNQLAQGAPTSPVVANMVAGALDRDLTRLARRYRSTYTRYADDLTFSRDGTFPTALGYWDSAASGRETRVGDALKAAVESNGFELRMDKVHLRFHDERQVVTGLVVNEKVNVRRPFIRRIRAMLHAWEKFGEAAAEKEHFGTYDDKDRAPHAEPTFRQVVKGHIDFLGMIRGTNDRWYREFIDQYSALVPSYVPRPASSRKPNHLRTWKDAIWVIESDGGQGTAFELVGYGLVTCAHVIRDIGVPGTALYTNPRVYSLHNPGQAFPVRVLAFDDDLDLAILDFDAPSGSMLKSKPLPALASGDRVHAAGYPSHSPGAHLWEEEGHVTHVRRHMNHPRHMVTMRIVEGASGSPIMDQGNRVVAVATVGVPSFAATVAGGPMAQPGSGYGVVPIRLLDRLPPARTGAAAPMSPP